MRHLALSAVLLIGVLSCGRNDSTARETVSRSANATASSGLPSFLAPRVFAERSRRVTPPLLGVSGRTLRLSRNRRPCSPRAHPDIGGWSLWTSLFDVASPFSQCP